MYDLNADLGNLVVEATWAAEKFNAEAAALRKEAADPARRAQYSTAVAYGAIVERELIAAAERLETQATVETDRAAWAKRGVLRLRGDDLRNAAWQAQHRELIAAATEAGRVQYDTDAEQG
jgi:hypothetical protein